MIELSEPNKPLKVFCSYAHEDESGLDALRSNLRSLSIRGLIEDWHDRKIPPGAFWDDEIKQQLDAADLILLLISADFIDSDYCMGLEVKRAYEKAAEGSATVIPIFYRNCHIKGMPFADGQGTPRDMQWVCDRENQDAAWSEVTVFIERAVNYRQPQATPNKINQCPLSLGSLGSISTQVGNVDVLVPTQISWPSKLLRILLLLAVVILSLGVWQWFFSFDGKSRTAKTLLIYGFYAEAREECQLALSSAFRKECLQITDLALGNSQAEEVRELKLIEMKSVYAELLLAHMAIYKQNYPDARIRFERITKKYPDIPQLHFGLGSVLHLLNQPKQALAEYELALGGEEKAIDRIEYKRILANIAGAYADSGKLGEAEERYRILLRKDQSYMIGHIQLVRVLVDQGKIEEAQKHVIAAQNIFNASGTQKLQSQSHNAQNWWYMGDEGKPITLNNWQLKNDYMSRIFGSAFRK